MTILSNKKLDALMENMKALQFENVRRLANFSAQIFPIWKKFEDAYETMDMIHACVKKLATNAAMIPFYGYDKAKDNDLPEGDKLVKFLETLDFEQKELMYTYLWDRGEVFAFKNTLEEGVNQGLQSLSFLHPANISLIISQGFPTEIVRYVYTDIDTQDRFEIELEDMIFIKFPNPSRDKIKRLRGLAPADVLARTLTRVDSEDDASTAQLQNGGVPSIVYDETPGTDTVVTGQRRDNFARFLRNSSNKGMPYFSANKLGVIQLGSTLVDLKVTELNSVDFGRVCNVFGISTILFNDKSASTESNVKEMKAEMFENIIIPNVKRVCDKLNKEAVPFIKTKGIIEEDTSEIKALQEDEAALVVSLAGAWWLKGNEKRERMKYDKDIDDPLMEKYIVPSGFMLLDDLNLVVEPIDNSANDYAPQLDANGKPIKQPKVVPLKTGTDG